MILNPDHFFNEYICFKLQSHNFNSVNFLLESYIISTIIVTTERRGWTETIHILSLHRAQGFTN